MNQKLQVLQAQFEAHTNASRCFIEAAKDHADKAKKILTKINKLRK